MIDATEALQRLQEGNERYLAGEGGAASTQDFAEDKPSKGPTPTSIPSFRSDRNRPSRLACRWQVDLVLGSTVATCDNECASHQARAQANEHPSRIGDHRHRL
jgi:hypothetical protein